jgi:ATP-binding cassette, subfamily C, bacterial LapB
MSQLTPQEMLTKIETEILRPSSMPTQDPLVLAIVDMARRQGVPRLVDGISSGLPLVNGRLPLEYLGEACERAGLSAKITKRSISDLMAHDFPVMLPMKDGSVFIATGLENSGADRHIVIEKPLSDRPEAISQKDLESSFSGNVIRIRPMPETLDNMPTQNGSTARKWFISAFQGTGVSYAHVILATIALNALALALPLFTMNVYDRVIPNGAMDSLAALSIGAIVAIAFDFLMRSLRGDLVDIAGRAADVRLANGVFGRLLGARLTQKTASTGAQANTLREFESLREFFQSLTLTTLSDVPFAIAFFVAIYIIAGPLVLAPAIAAPLILLVCLIIQRKLSSMMRDQFRDNAIRNAVAVEVLVGLETIKSLGAESWAAERWERATADGIRTSTAIRSLTNLAGNIIVASQSLVTVLMVLHGAHLVLTGVISTGALIAAVMLAGRALGPVGQMALLMTRAFQARQAFEALKPVLESPQERDASRSFVATDKFKGSLALKSVSYAYEPDGPKALNAIDLNINAYERVAILGSIGSGKTTLLKLFPALIFASQGQAHVDGTNVEHIDPAALRRQVSYVPQDALLFRASLRNNILIHAPRASEKDLLDAISISGAAEWINRLPHGLDSVIGERGQGLSGGQRQMIALARALVTRPRILLLDEPTGSMDGVTEKSLLARLARYVGENRATLVVVTHRPAVLDIVNRIIVLDKGIKRHDGPKATVLTELSTTQTTPSAVQRDVA